MGKNVGKDSEDYGKKWVKKDEERENVYWPTDRLKEKCHISDKEIYEKAKKDPHNFWSKKAKDMFDWFEDWDEVMEWNPPYFNWFLDSKTNLSYNCLDRHLKDKRNKAAIIWEPEPLEEEKRILTYQDLYRKVNKFANKLKELGVEKDDPVTFWMPMIPETAIAALACQRIGAWHSIVFTAFSPKAVKQRMEDAGSEILITVDGFYRRGKTIELKEQINETLDEIEAENCIVVQRAETNPSMDQERDHFYDELMNKSEEYCEPEPIDAEDTGFLLYTSGTTGKPKGIKHSCGAYGVQAALTMKWIFDIHENDVFFSTADIGWITGHSYSLYGPLALGATQIWYEGSPDYPKPDRLWKIIEENGVTQFYTAPTAIRALRKEGDGWVEKHDLKSLRILGSVGEPIDTSTWKWYFEKVGGGRCPIVDTYWQTETGGILLTSLPGVGPFVPGVAGPPLPGIGYDVLDATGEPVKEEESGEIVIDGPYFGPGMLRGIYKNPEKYEEEYFSEFGEEVYFSGDGGVKRELEIGGQNLIEVTGRIDDVLEVAGHRLGSAEIEDAIDNLDEIMESAVVGKPHDVKGEVPAVFAVLKQGETGSDELRDKIVKIVREEVGPVATPYAAYFVTDLPKTESGKIIRRFLKGLVRDEELGDMTTASNPSCLSELAEKVGYNGPQEIPDQ
ncbi:MAG: Acyl-coenzyme A synthetase/AMP-(fatty) acid ligase Asc [Candidatus Methanohalarchaeum thermophilum]|uniref:Acetate--CoA ligase n=1 Tax=Methanohalarchaeum thermophilum TaxID=1903181 RepID=A0A1Q6DTL9_METT1|nr:MAG: Acyl-coenzyme A synthetase/AMP-(fatty) acid ligase Asc [Candidatus Methanohalarchaeum thermophilum]